MSDATPSPSGPAPALPSCRGAILDFVQTAAVFVAIVLGLLAFADRMNHLESAFDRVEAKLDRLYLYHAERDRLWAQHFGLPVPPLAGPTADAKEAQPGEAE